MLIKQKRFSSICYTLQILNIECVLIPLRNDGLIPLKNLRSRMTSLNKENIKLIIS